MSRFGGTECSACTIDCATCSLDASGSQALNHERECKASGENNVIIAGNVCWDRAEEPVQRLIYHLTRMTPQDAWKPERMQKLLEAYNEAEEALGLCPRGPSFREEMSLSRCVTPAV